MCQDSSVTCVRQQAQFDAGAFNLVLKQISAPDRDGYAHPHILSILKGEVSA